MLVGTRLALFASAALASLAIGCSSEESGGSNPTAALGTPSLGFRSVGEVTNPTGNVPIDLGCDMHVPVTVDVKNWTLRPPGACFGYPQCGQLAIIVDPIASPDGGPSIGESFEPSATPFVLVDFASLPNPEGSHVLRAELVEDGTRTVAIGTDAKPLAQELSVTTKLPIGCDAGPDAETDANTADGGSVEEDAATGDSA